MVGGRFPRRWSGPLRVTWLGSCTIVPGKPASLQLEGRYLSTSAMRGEAVAGQYTVQGIPVTVSGHQGAQFDGQYRSLYINSICVFPRFNILHILTNILELKQLLRRITRILHLCQLDTRKHPRPRPRDHSRTLDYHLCCVLALLRHLCKIKHKVSTHMHFLLKSCRKHGYVLIMHL